MSTTEVFNLILESQCYNYSESYNGSNLPVEYIELMADRGQTWQEIFKDLSNFTMNLDTPVTLQLDWTPLQSKNSPYLLTGIQTTESTSISNYELELIMYNIFLIINLSCPGCLDFYKCYITKEDERIIDLYLDGSRFESAWLAAKESGFINVSRIPIEKTFQWFSSLNIRSKQTAATNIERALFALLHFCNEDIICPSKLVWLSHALEALYGTSDQDTIANDMIKENIIKSEKKENAKKIIYDLFDITNSFIHGKYDIYHPLDNDMLDEKLSDKLVLTCLFRNSFALILAKIQKDILTK